MALSESLNVQAERELNGTVCQSCSELKAPGRAFCIGNYIHDYLERY